LSRLLGKAHKPSRLAVALDPVHQAPAMARESQVRK
jgi:hypothetical protein